LITFCARTAFTEDSFPRDRLENDDKVPWQITAKSLTYKEDEKAYFAHGDVVISKGDQFLYTQKAIYNTQTGIARVSGGVRLEVAGDTLSGEQGFFNLKNQTGELYGGRLFLSENHYYINGEVMEKVGKNTYLIKGCQLTTCDGNNPAWTITGSEVRVTIEGYGKMKDAAFRVRGLPLLYVPYMIFPAKTRRQTGLLPPRMGYSTHKGIDIEAPFFWAISGQTDATLYQRFMGNRGYMQGMEFRYLAEEDSRGAFLFDILSDEKEKKDLNDPDDAELSPFDRTNRTRYWFRSKLDQDLFHSWAARLDIDFVSDQDYLREFEGGLFGFEARPDLAAESGRFSEERQSPTRRSGLRLSHDGEEYSLQVATGYHQRPEDPSEDNTPQPVGGLTFMVLPDKIMDFSSFFTLESDYDYVWRDVGERGHRLSISPELRFPVWLLGSYLEFGPSIRYIHVTQWVNDPEEDRDRHYKRAAYEAGASLSANAERVYDFRWRNIRRLKHRVSPVISYAYRVHHDEEDPRPWFEPVDEESKLNGIINTVSLSLENLLDARQENEKGEVTYRQWAMADLTQGYDIDEARRHEEPERKKEPFTPLSAEIILRPFHDFDLFAMGQWDHYEHHIASTTLSGEFSVDRSGGREDTYKLDYHHVRDSQNEGDSQRNLDFWLHVNLACRFAIGGSLERDMDLDQDISNSYWLEYLSQCWGIRLAMEKEDEETVVMVSFRLLGLGDVRDF
jgi:LPS-assembly protein